MAKSQPKAAASSVAAKTKAADSRCDEGQEFTPFSIAVARSAVVDLDIQVCRTLGRVRVWLDEVLQLDETGADGVGYRVPPVGPGPHLLFWSIQPADTDWRTRDELRVDGVVRFRRKKASDGNNPVNAGFIFLEVQ